MSTNILQHPGYQSIKLFFRVENAIILTNGLKVETI